MWMLPTSRAGHLQHGAMQTHAHTAARHSLTQLPWCTTLSAVMATNHHVGCHDQHMYGCQSVSWKSHKLTVSLCWSHQSQRVSDCSRAVCVFACSVFDRAMQTSMFVLPIHTVSVYCILCQVHVLYPGVFVVQVQSGISISLEQMYCHRFPHLLPISELNSLVLTMPRSTVLGMRSTNHRMLWLCTLRP